MKRNQKKFTLSFQVNGSVDYTVSPAPTVERHNQLCHKLEFDCDVNTTSCIKIFINGPINSENFIQIISMKYNGIDIPDINLISFLRTPQGEILKKYGYIDSEGEFVIKLHTNPVSLNYLNYLLSLTKPK